MTKKLLVPFDPARPEWSPKDFLIPWFREGKVEFRGLKNSKTYEFGLMVYTGRSVSENDLFARLVDSGAYISNVDATLTNIRRYLDQLGNLRVGNVVRIVAADEDRELFRLELVAKSPSSAAKQFKELDEG